MVIDLRKTSVYILVGGLLSGCGEKGSSAGNEQRNDALQTVTPVVVTEKVLYDSDDPAIWINPDNPDDVIIIGTDKGGDAGDGGLYAFDLSGQIIDSVKPLKRPNNVDIAYGLTVSGVRTDVAVCTERNARSIRVFSLPGLESLDGGGIPVFEGEPDSLRDPMGIALYTDPFDKQIYAIVGRKTGPTDGTYLWQYVLEETMPGRVSARLVRKLGYYSGKKEIESIAVDNELGYVYYSDEQHGIHKAYAHPDSSSIDLALFGMTGFTSDIEGISIYKSGSASGYIVVSDQQANLFRVFPRNGLPGSRHHHPEIAAIPLSTVGSDGSEVTNASVPGFPGGFLVAMSDDGTFQIYRWQDIARKFPLVDETMSVPVRE